MDDLLKQRLQKGIAYFWKLKPSEWNSVHVVHLHTFLKLVDQFVNGGRSLTVEQMTTDEIEKIFR